MTKLKFLCIGKCDKLSFDKCININKLIINAAVPISLNHLKNLNSLPYNFNIFKLCI